MPRRAQAAFRVSAPRQKLEVPAASRDVRVEEKMFAPGSSQLAPERRSIVVEPRRRPRPGRLGPRHQLRPVCFWRIRSSRRCERLTLLYDIGARNLGLLVTVLAACVRRVGRHHETVAGLQGAGWLAFDREIKAA